MTIVSVYKFKNPESADQALEVTFLTTENAFIRTVLKVII
jgi:hypothetical protein